jgi:RimJ/RimL family protein N-acetyltransferase
MEGTDTDHDGGLGRPIDPTLLALRVSLPRKPAPVTLEGQLVILRPTDPDADAAPLFAASCGQAMSLGGRSVPAYDADLAIWRYMPDGPFADVTALGRSLRMQSDAVDATPLTVLDRASAVPVGLVNLMSNDPANLKIELGGIWYGPIAQRTCANTDATWLMLRHAFGLGYRRVEWKCDSLNARSRHAALRMGFRFEGIQEQHRITKGRNRDTAWFRIVAEEWPMVDARLRDLLTRPTVALPAPA